MLSATIRRRYVLPENGATGLSDLDERILTALNSVLTPEELKATIAHIPGLSSLIAYQLPEPLSDEELQKVYGLPPPGPLRLNPLRIHELSQADRRIRLYKSLNTRSAYSYRVEAEKIVRGILTEQRFVCAWTHNGFRQPGVKLVRPATPEEDGNKIDAVMECDNGTTCRFQLKSGLDANFYDLAVMGIVLVRVNVDYLPEQMRHAAIEAILNYRRFRKNCTSPSPHC